MNKKIFISGQTVNLDRTADEVKKEIQSAIDKYYPTPNDFVQVEEYKEINNYTCEFTIKRNYVNDAGAALGAEFVCDHDESLLTGLDIAAFQPFDPSKTMIVPQIPWNDDMVYSPVKTFCNLWKQQIKVMAKEEIKKITLIPSINGISVKIVFK